MVIILLYVYENLGCSSSNYNPNEGVITSEVDSNKTSIFKNQFCRLLGFTAIESLVDPESISSSTIIEMFYQMGYLKNITLLSKFRKPNLPPLWNGLFTLLFNNFSERVTGSDSASKLFCTIIYGLYIGINLDYGSILWAQLIKSTLSSTRHSDISSARLWSIIIKRAIVYLQVQVQSDFVLPVTPILQTSNFMVSDPSKFDFISSIPESMLLNVPTENVVIDAYRKKPGSGICLMPKYFLKALKDGNKPKKGGNIKGKVGPSEPAQTPKRRLRRLLTNQDLLLLSLKMIRIPILFRIFGGLHKFRRKLKILLQLQNLWYQNQFLLNPL